MTEDSELWSIADTSVIPYPETGVEQRQIVEHSAKYK